MANVVHVPAQLGPDRVRRLAQHRCQSLQAYVAALSRMSDGWRGPKYSAASYAL